MYMYMCASYNYSNYIGTRLSLPPHSHGDWTNHLSIHTCTCHCMCMYKHLAYPIILNVTRERAELVVLRNLQIKQSCSGGEIGFS